MHATSMHKQIPETQDNKPVRVTGVPATQLLGGPQGPPYVQMATYISNAFLDPDFTVKMMQDSSVCSSGVEGSSSYVQNLHAEYEYQEERLVSITFTKIDESGLHELYSLKQFTYADDKLTGYVYSRWNTGWTPVLRESLVYDSNGRNTSVTSQIWASDDWQNSSQDTYDFENGQLTRVERAVWDGGSWKSESRTNAEYNTNKLTTRVTFLQNLNESWDTISQDNYLYDSDLDFFLMGYSHSMPDPVSNILRPMIRELYDYNDLGFFTDRTVQVWNDSVGNWENYVKDEFVYGVLGIWKSWRRPELDW